ncbi:peptidoglycan-binding protein [Microbacterium sp. QXD-8]|uniref:Peptidoglycan-binding protein n=1 Tax=Microbacterium psychrotolerans TaxID=3068321 RepID=A0ABU0Z0M7_9MICO|nr:peptidoglycan-binding protein [Microbacterium sp. QXD-8]MDQ7877379.1 peptidoglycan-binding protein [Microbacterium sp. QXD-8]
MRYANGSQTRPRVSSPFGPRKASGGASSFHRGADQTGIGAVRASAAGRVVVTGTPSGWSAGGRQVWIQHDGCFSKSLHLASWAVSSGQWVNEGDIIGAEDTTGTASGKHLHQEITPGALHYRNEGQVDPMAYIAARLTTGSTAGGANGWYASNGGAAYITRIQELLKAVGYSITVDGKDGPQTQGAVRDFQSKNALTVDGIAGPFTKAVLEQKAAHDVGRNAIPEKRSAADIQRLVGANPDGIYGPDTTAKVKAWQSANGLTADGIWGDLSDAKGFPPPAAKLEVDGNLGELTIKELQRSLGFTGEDVDGQIGPKTTAAMNAALGVTGNWDATIRAMQQFLGVHIDGDWGQETTRALQTLLNNGKKLGAVVDPGPPAPPAGTGRNATSRPNSAIQELLKREGLYAGDIDGQYGPATTAAVVAYQSKHFLEPDGIWGTASDGIGFPPAGSIFGIDYSFARPDPVMLAQRGVKLAGRYLWPARHASKGITRGEYDALAAAGIATFFIYEEDGKELLGGREAGVRVAGLAEVELAALGLAGHPIYFNVDYDAPATDMPKILDALDGIASVIGKDRVGLYAGYGPLKAAFDAGKIAWGFQTYAWSGGKWDPRAQLQQWANGQWGGSVDFTRAMVAEFGQNPVTPDPEPEPDMTSIPTPLAKQLWEWLKGVFGGGS